MSAPTALQGRVGEAIARGHRLIEAWGSWGATLSPDARSVAFVSDRSGSPAVYVQDLPTDHEQPVPEAVALRIGDDPVVAVEWSADGAWLACLLATDGGVRTQVWVVRPDGRDARRLAGSTEQHAELGPWTRSGHRLAVTVPGVDGERTHCHLADPVTGVWTPLLVGDLLTVLDLSVDEELVIVRDGERGKQFCVVVDRVADADHPLLPYPAVGSTERAMIRPAPGGADPAGADPAGADRRLIAYLATDAGLPRRQCVALPLGPDGWRGESGVLAPREDAELEFLDADDAGQRLLLVWNVAGRSEAEWYDTRTDRRLPIAGLPGQVVSGALLSRDGTRALFTVEGPGRPRRVWSLEAATGRWSPATAAGPLPEGELIEPELVHYAGSDGLPLSGWLYRVPGRTAPGPAMLSLHGGPEAQERPTFNPQHQAMVAAGIAVFAPNIRGSSGFGRAFVHADDVHGRRGAFDDVSATAELVIELGVADPARLAVTGRSYGGYLTLAMLAFTPGTFAAGVDICGMSDLLTFYRDTEPWIAAAAVSKYGDPVKHRDLLRALSPLGQVTGIDVPLLVAHGELDTNVPLNEATQVVAALRSLGRPVEYLELAAEGHEYRRLDSRQLLLQTMVEFLDRHLAG